MRKSSMASSPTPPAIWLPSAARTMGRAGRPLRHCAGMRTTMPAASMRGRSCRKRSASATSQRSGW